MAIKFYAILYPSGLNLCDKCAKYAGFTLGEATKGIVCMQCQAVDNKKEEEVAK
jgi:hypothetical protein